MEVFCHTTALFGGGRAKTPYDDFHALLPDKLK